MPSPLGGVKDPIVVVRGAEIERGRGAAAQELDDPELGCRLDPVAVEGRLVGPGAKPQPVEELEAVRLVAEQRLHDVDVALDEARKHCRIAGIEDAGGIVIIAHVLSVTAVMRPLLIATSPRKNSPSETIGRTRPPRITRSGCAGRVAHDSPSGEGSADRAWNSRRV